VPPEQRRLDRRPDRREAAINLLLASPHSSPCTFLAVAIGLKRSVIVLFVAYMILGTLYKRYRLGFQGWDAVPHRDIWLRIGSTCGLCKREGEYAIQI
jgi:hypothetical protein